MKEKSLVELYSNKIFNWHVLADWMRLQAFVQHNFSSQTFWLWRKIYLRNYTCIVKCADTVWMWAVRYNCNVYCDKPNVNIVPSWEADTGIRPTLSCLSAASHLFVIPPLMRSMCPRRTAFKSLSPVSQLSSCKLGVDVVPLKTITQT